MNRRKRRATARAQARETFRDRTDRRQALQTFARLTPATQERALAAHGKPNGLAAIGVEAAGEVIAAARAVRGVAMPTLSGAVTEGGGDAHHL